jgi:outer membrane protein TolC
MTARAGILVPLLGVTLLLAPRPAAAGALVLARPRPAAAPAPADTLRLTLDDALQRALTRSEEMRAAHALVKQTEGQVLEQLSRALPQVNGMVTYNRKIQSIFQDAVADTGFFGQILKNSSFAAQHTWSADLTAQQLLWSGGKVGAALKTARAANRSAHATERETASDLTYQVKQAYYDAIYARRLVEITESSLAQARVHLGQVQSGRREGTRSEYETLRAEVDAANQEPSVVAARNGLELARLALKRLVNVPPAQPVELVTPLAAADGMVPVVADLSTVVEGRPAVLAAGFEVEARRQAVKVYRGQRWPDLYVSSTLSHQAFPLDLWPRRNEFRRNWDASVRLELPIFTGLRTEGQVAQAQAQYEVARANRDRLLEGAAIEAVQARDELGRTLSSLFARRETVRQARRAWELAGVRFTNGMSTQIEVSDARLQLQSAEVNEVQAMRDYLVAIAALERAVGHPLPIERKPLEEVTISPNLEGTR